MAAVTATQSEIEEALTCQCGCGLTVHNCNHLQCPSGIPLKQEIAEQLAQGLPRTQVLDHFATKYGEKILSAPTTSGFNLVAWTMPFAVLLLAAALVVRVTRRWRRAPTAPRAAVVAPPADVSAGRQAQLEAELRDYDA